MLYTASPYDGPINVVYLGDNPSPTWPLERRVQWAVASFNEQVRPLLRQKVKIHQLYAQPRVLVSLAGVEALQPTVPDFAQRWLDILDQSVLEIERRVRQAAFLPT